MKIAKVRDVKTPVRGTSGSAGLDFFVPNDFIQQYIPPGSSLNIPSGIIANIPEGCALIAMNKSGVSLSKSLQAGACVIDEDYQGEIHLHILNIGTNHQLITPGMKLIQFVCLPINYISVQEVPASELFTEVTERGTGGFGSTNKHDLGTDIDLF